MAAAPEVVPYHPPTLSGPDSPWEAFRVEEVLSGNDSMDLKILLHSRLNERVDLAAVSSMAGERARAELRATVRALVLDECPWMS